MSSHGKKPEPEDEEVSLSGYSQGVSLLLSVFIFIIISCIFITSLFQVQQAEASAQLGIPPESPKEANVYRVVGLSEGDLDALADKVADKVEDKVSALLVIVLKQIQQKMQSSIEMLERALNNDL